MKNSTVDYILIIVIVAVLGIGGYFALSAVNSDIKNFFKNLTAPFSQFISTAGGFFTSISKGISSGISTLTTGTTTTNLQTGLTVQNNTGGITGTTGAGGNEQNSFINQRAFRGIISPTSTVNNAFGGIMTLKQVTQPTNPINPNLYTAGSLGRYNVFASNPQFVSQHMPQYSTNINLFSALAQPTNPNFVKIIKKPIPKVQGTAIGGYR